MDGNVFICIVQTYPRLPLLFRLVKSHAVFVKFQLFADQFPIPWIGVDRPLRILRYGRVRVRVIPIDDVDVDVISELFQYR